MKNLAFGTICALAASQSAGCIDPDTAFITASWTIKNTNSSTPASCPPGFDTAALYSQPVDLTYTPVGQPIIDLFDCADGIGISAALEPGVYLSWIEITNTNNTSVYAQSTSAVVDVTFADKSFSAEILADGGYFQFAWNLYGATSNADLSCAQAGVAGGVSFLATEVGNATNSAEDLFTCEDGTGITAGYEAGSYTVSVAALNAAMQAIGTAQEVTGVIQAPNKVTNLGTIEIPVTGL